MGATGGEGSDIFGERRRAAKTEDDVQPNVSSTEATEVGGVVSLGVATPAAELPAPAFQAGVASEVPDGFILHVRFRPDTTVWTIDECPAHLTNQEWFNLLCRRIGGRFAARAGGRGDFRLSRAELEAFKARNPN